MQSTLIVSKNKKSSEDYALRICKDFKINNFDITLIEKNPSGESKSNLIGISDVRNFQSKIFLKPIKSKNKAIILKNSQDITTEAQNALLKILEEPPPNTIVILTASNKETLLPTILSRCKIIKLKKTFDLSEKEFVRHQTILASLTTLSINEKLKLAQDYGKNKEEASIFLEKIIITARQQLINIINESPDNQTLSSRNILISLQKTYTIIKTTNANPRMILENLLL